MLASRGHQVIQWASTFDHFQKVQRSHTDHSTLIEPGYQLQLLKARPYKKHVGLARILSQKDVANRFRIRALEKNRPDLILVSLPTLELAEAVFEFARPRNIPVIVDVRDLWPDVFLTVAPRWAHSFVRPFLRRLDQKAQLICRQAAYLTGVSESYLDWGLAKAGRNKQPEERPYYLAYPKKILTVSQRDEIGKKLSAAGVKVKRRLRCCFFGTLGKSAGIRAIVQMARCLRERGHSDIEFVMCGRGPRERELQDAIRELPQVRYLGWLNAEELTGLMERSDIGLAIYEGGVLQSIPNKPVEYLAGGLSVLTTLEGELGRLLRSNQCGDAFGSNEIEAMSDWLIRRRCEPNVLSQERKQAAVLFKKEFDAKQVYGRMIDWMETVPRAERLRVAA